MCNLFSFGKYNLYGVENSKLNLWIQNKYYRYIFVKKPGTKVPGKSSQNDISEVLHSHAYL